MKPGFNVKSILLLFLVVLAVYLTGFYAIEYLRHRNGPWEVTFVTNAQGKPAIGISQSTLKIASVTLLFLDEITNTTNVSETLTFDHPRQVVPFGTVLFEDLTFLPGTVTLGLFGHEVELLPRTLVVNGQPVPWNNSTVIELTAADKPAPPPQAPANSAGR